MNDEPKIKSLAKALSILECFSVREPELGITQISQHLGLNKSNVHSILSTFQQMGYIERLPSGKYCLGLKLFEYAFVINQHLGYPKAIYDILYDIAQQADEIVYFGIPRGTNVLYLYVVHPRSKVGVLPYRDILGEKAPLYGTGIGKAILAFLPESEWVQRIPEERVRRTKNTMTDMDTIIEALRTIRKNGYSIDNEENDLGVRCVGVPVINSFGQLVAGVSISGPVSTMTDIKIQECVKIIQEASFRMRERIYN